MVQFNLLPDVKIEYMKAKRTKRTVMLISIGLTGLAVFVVVLLFMIVNVFQKQHIAHLNDDIKTKTEELESIPDLDKVLTVQNQMNALTELHEGKPATSRLYDYLIRLTPKDAKISDVQVDFEASTIVISGSATNLETVNKFTDTLKFADYKVGETTDKAFSGVVLASFGLSQSAGGQDRTAYAIQFSFKPEIFDNTKTVELIVPNIISTRSVTEAPTDLFEAKPAEE